MSQFL
jgi:hypothetical protein